MQTLVAMLFLAAPDDFLSMDLGSSLFLDLGSAFREMLGLAELSWSHVRETSQGAKYALGVRTATGSKQQAYTMCAILLLGPRE